MTEQLLFAGRALWEPDAAVLREMLTELPDGERYLALLPPPLELQREHTRLFFSPEGAACPPWQSVHSPEPTIMGETHHSAMGWYREAGVQPVAETEPADHVGLLLSFYAKLVEEGAPPETLARFRDEHLGWIPAFCERLEAASRLPFYQELARETRVALRC